MEKLRILSMVAAVMPGGIALREKRYKERDQAPQQPGQDLRFEGTAHAENPARH